MATQVLSAAVLEWVAARDHGLMRRVNNWMPPRWLRLWIVAATRGGDGWLWYGYGGAVACFGGPERVHALLAAALAVGLGIALFIRMKRWCGRKRPCAMAPHCWATLLPPDQFSFPSGHTITAFAMAASLAAFYPVLLPTLLLCAFCVAASRILLGMHFLSDVVVGAAIGAGLGWSMAAVPSLVR